jgi:hypothetical protein
MKTNFSQTVHTASKARLMRYVLPLSQPAGTQVQGTVLCNAPFELPTLNPANRQAPYRYGMSLVLAEASGLTNDLSFQCTLWDSWIPTPPTSSIA